MNLTHRFLTCLLGFLTSVALAAAPVKKHTRGTGLIPPQPNAKGTVPKTANKKPGASKLTPSGRSKTPIFAPPLAIKAPEVKTNEAAALEAIAPVTGQCAKKPPVEDYVRIASSWSPQAANASGVYFVSDRAEVAQIFFQSTESTEAKQLTRFPDGVPYFELSPDGSKILAATHVGGDEQYRIHLLDTTTDAIKGLLEDEGTRVESVSWGPDSKWFAYTSNKRNKIDFDLYRFDLESGKTRMLAELEGHNSVTDVSPDGKMILLTRFRSISDGDVLLFKDGGVDNVTRGLGAASHGPARFTADASHILLLTDSPKGLRRLISLTVKGKTPKDLSSEKVEIEAFGLDRKRQALMYLVNDEGYSRVRAFDLDDSGRKAKPWALAKDDNSVARSVDFAYAKSGRADGLFVADTSSTRPSEIWLDRTSMRSQWTRSSQKLAGTKLELDPACFHGEKLVRYLSFDGKSIPAFLFEPTNESGLAPPYLVYVHGGPEAQFRPSFNRVFQYFLQRGFGILAPNVRGSTGYGRDYADLDNYKKRMGSVQDAVEGARWLLSERLAAAGRLAIYGGSYGGFMVLRSIQVAPDLFAAASESVGISDFVTFLENTKPYRRTLREVEYGPLADRTFLKSVSPMTYLDRIKTPLYVFHGANDPRVPVTEAHQIVEALKQRSVPVELRVFADEGHGNAKLGNQLEQARLMAHFFEKHLEAVVAAPPKN